MNVVMINATTTRTHPVLFSLFVSLCLCGELAMAEERQITFTPKHHNLDNNDNFSPDDRFLVYDTREMAGPGIENSQSVEHVEIATGDETVLYAPDESVMGAQAAPGVGAVTYAHHAPVVAFIHGPPLDQVDTRGYYAKPNRNGASVPADGSGALTWLDHRDVTSEDTPPGAHRGGTHRHEYTRNGNRIGCTYDDFLLPQYGRTIAYMEPHADAPGEASHWFAIAVPVVPEHNAAPGELVMAAGDSWVDPAGTMRAFIGKVREGHGGFTESLYVVDIPADVDITTADAGGKTRFPQPPAGVSVRRLTHEWTSGWAGGIVRGSPAGDRIAYYGKDANGRTQIFVIPSDGSDQSDDPAKEPQQVTHFENGAGPGLRWHASGHYVACVADNRVAVTSVRDGKLGETRYLTDGDGAERLNLVWSHDGNTLAFNQAVVHPNGAKDYAGNNFLQVFTVDFNPF